MSWEEMYRRREPCPCRKGEVEVVGYSDDWGRLRTDHRMLCSTCASRYVYSDEVVRSRHGREVERGWIERDNSRGRGR